MSAILLLPSCVCQIALSQVLCFLDVLHVNCVYGYVVMLLGFLKYHKNGINNGKNNVADGLI